MAGYVVNLGAEATSNADYRRVVYTGHYSQLVLMSLAPGEEIGNEQHGLDQFIRVEAGTATTSLGNGAETHELSAGWAIVVPAGTWHNIRNSGSEPLKLSTLYSPPQHQDKVVESTKADEHEEHFDGTTTE